MKQKGSKTVSHELINIHSALKEHLMKDFSASLASQIIEHNFRKHGAEIKNSQKYARLINAIISDYRGIRPLGHSTVANLRKSLQDAVKQIGK